MRSNDHAGGGSPRRRRAPPEEARLNRQREPLPTRIDSLPDLPDAYARELDRALGALRVVLDPAARAAIDGHVRLLLAWNAAINLTAITEPAVVARLHVADSLAALHVLRAGPCATLLDLGSGGGFPGLPLAAALPGTRALLVDSVAKKVAFLDAVRRAVGLADRVGAAATRAEALRPAGAEAGWTEAGRAEAAGAEAAGAEAGRAEAGWEVVTARAVGRLNELVELALPLLAVGGQLVAWKRGDLDEELAAARRAAAALGGDPPMVHPVPTALGLEGHVLVVVRKERPTPTGYPRDPAARKRRPW
ncbi:MAG: 16S rRNA (guanine(527)-N(7))-methyltransferase RsmG [Anaerolinea sp.]|nr:16S rRNA (guanine(527)-N(7))-methyltransferase RsmG [Anaerolinea sp.]